MKGRKPRPTQIKILEGEKNKNRINRREPKPHPGRPTCPDHHSPAAKSEWKRIVPQREEMGRLSKNDRTELALYCQAYARWKKAEDVLNEKGELYKTQSGNVITSPMLWVANKAMEQCHKFLVEFGMTPASRGRINVAGPGEDDGWNKLLDFCSASSKRGFQSDKNSVDE